MRISPISNSYYIKSKTPKAPVQNIKNTNIENSSSIAPISFSGLMRMGKDFTRPVDSAFFRDYPALMSAANILRENFPDGAEILDYACSDGEEALSLYMLLGEDRENFKITGIDIGDDPINLANQGVYSLFGGGLDEFLMPGAKKDPTESELSKLFYEIMEPTDEPAAPLNNSPEFAYTILSAKPKFRKQLFFKPKDEVRENLEFRIGDIYEMENEPTKDKVGAIFFRNAFYHLMNSSDGEDLLTGGVVKKIFENNFNDDDDVSYELIYGKQNSLDRKQAIADEIIDKVYDKLEIGGVFVLGNSVNESIFLAEDDTPDEETVRYGDTETYRQSIKNIEKNANNRALRFDARFIPILKDARTIMQNSIDRIKEQEDVRILKKTPMQKALERDNRFAPVYASEIKGLPGLETPTVWVKVK